MQFISFNTKFLVLCDFDTQFLVVYAKFIIFAPPRAPLQSHAVQPSHRRALARSCNHSRDLSIASMCIQSSAVFSSSRTSAHRPRPDKQRLRCAAWCAVYLQSFERSINRRHVYTTQTASETDLSIAGMYIQRRQHQRRIYQSPACIYNADSIRDGSINRRHVYTTQTASETDLSIAGMYIQSRQRSITYCTADLKRSCGMPADFIILNANFLVFDTEFLVFESKIHDFYSLFPSISSSVHTAISRAIPQKHPCGSRCGADGLCAWLEGDDFLLKNDEFLHTLRLNLRLRPRQHQFDRFHRLSFVLQKRKLTRRAGLPGSPLLILCLQHSEPRCPLLQHLLARQSGDDSGWCCSGGQACGFHHFNTKFLVFDT